MFWFFFVKGNLHFNIQKILIRKIKVNIQQIVVDFDLKIPILILNVIELTRF